MEIQSAFNSGVQGFQQAVETANTAASGIVRATESRAVANAENEFQEESTEISADKDDTNLPNNGTNITNLNQSIVQLKVAEYQAKASTEVIKTADENLGTLLDVTV